MQIDLNTLQQCKFKGTDVNEIYYNNVKIWPIEPILNFIDPVPDGDYLSFAPVISNANIKMKHWCINFKIFKYYRYNIYNNLFNNTNGIIFGEKRIDKFVDGQFIKGTWQPIRFEEDVNILYNEILRVRWSNNLNVNWNDIKTQYNAVYPQTKEYMQTKVNIIAVCLLKQNNNYSVVNDECYLYGKLKPFKDNTGNYIDDVMQNHINNLNEINRFFVPPVIYAEDDLNQGYYRGDDLTHEHNLIYNPINKLELLDPTIILDEPLVNNINAKCYNLISYNNFKWKDGEAVIINNLELEFTEKVDDNWINKWPTPIAYYSGPMYVPYTPGNLTKMNNFKIIVNGYVSNLKYILPRCFHHCQVLEYVKLDYDGVLNANNASQMFIGAGRDVEHPVLVKRGGAATVDRAAIGMGDNWVIKDFDEE